MFHLYIQVIKIGEQTAAVALEFSLGCISILFIMEKFAFIVFDREGRFHCFFL